MSPSSFISLVLALWFFALSCAPAIAAERNSNFLQPGVQSFSLSARQLRIAATSNQIMFVKIGDDEYELLCRCGPKIKYDELPKYAVDALVAVEDKRFYDHHGFDPLGAIRAMLHYNPFGKGRPEGGSTITQQLIKNTMMNPGDGWTRKWEEKELSERLETGMSKPEVLLAYFNQMSFGNSDRGRMIVGIEQAARFYFGRRAKSLNLYETAILVGMLKAPFIYNPLSNPDKAKDRAVVVLRRMVDQGKITAKEAAVATRTGIRSFGNEEAIWVETRNFTDWVMADIKKRLPRFKATTRTHIPLTLQIMPQFRAETAIKKSLAFLGMEELEAAYIAMGFDGGVKVMVGQRDFNKHRINFAVQSIRQPASTFKAIVFVAALRLGKLKIDNIKKHLFAMSDNDLAHQVLASIGAPAVVKMAKDLGVKSKLNPVPSLALGTSEVRLIEMVRAYVPFANQGLLPEPFGYWGVVDAGEGLIWRNPIQRQAISNKIANQMKELLRAVVVDVDGTAHIARLVPGALGKTGTSSGPRDAWFIGSVSERVSGIWIGRPDSAKLSDSINGHFAAKVWRDIELMLTE